MGKLAFAILVLCCAAIAPVHAQERIQAPPGEAYTHAPSGMTFPAGVGDFRRVSLTRFSQTGDNESAGYNLDIDGDLKIAATVFIYPSPGLVSIASPQETQDVARALLCERQFSTVQREIQTVYPDAARLDGVLTAAVSPLRPSVAYTFEVANFGGPRTVVRSEVHLNCYVGDHWTLKYRFTYPADFDARGAIDTFMRDLAVTVAP
jgi:hypothetical protein